MMFSDITKKKVFCICLWLMDRMLMYLWISEGYLWIIDAMIIEENASSRRLSHYQQQHNAIIWRLCFWYIYLHLYLCGEYHCTMTWVINMASLLWWLHERNEFLFAIWIWSIDCVYIGSSYAFFIVLFFFLWWCLLFIKEFPIYYKNCLVFLETWQYIEGVLW